MVMFLVGSAMVAAWLITVAQLPQQLAQLLGPLMQNPRLLMLVIMLLVLAVGMVMDLAPTVLILVPLLMPVVTMAGIDPVCFGLMFILNCSIGLLTPPVGTVLNVVCGVGKVPLSVAARGTLPFIGAYVVLLGLFIAFPQIIIVPARILGGLFQREETGMSMIKTLGLASALALAGMAAQAQTTLRFAHPVPETDLQHTMAVFFAEQVAARTNGAVTVQIFPQGQLGNDSAMIDGARSGIIDIVLVGLNNFTGLVPAAGVFELPFMFPTRDLAYAALDGEVGQGTSARFTEHGLTVLGYPENGFRQMSNNRGPIRTPADLAGINMRTNNARALNDMFAALGANPIQLRVAELYTALETGVVDAQDHPLGVVMSFKFDEVQRYLTLTRHAYSALGLMMNSASFERLSA